MNYLDMTVPPAEVLSEHDLATWRLQLVQEEQDLSTRHEAWIRSHSGWRKALANATECAVAHRVAELEAEVCSSLANIDAARQHLLRSTMATSVEEAVAAVFDHLSSDVGSLSQTLSVDSTQSMPVAMPQELQRSQQQARQLEARLNTSRAEYEAKFSILQRINDSLREDLLALQTQGGLLNCTRGGRLSRIVEELEKRAEELQTHNHLPPDQDARRRDITVSLVRAEGRIRQLESREQQLMEQLENVTQELRSARVRIEQLEEVRAAEDRVTGNPAGHQGMWPGSRLVSLRLDSDAIAVQRRARRMAERQHWHCAARHWDQLEAANRLLEGSRCSPISSAPAAPSLQ